MSLIGYVLGSDQNTCEFECAIGYTVETNKSSAFGKLFKKILGLSLSQHVHTKTQSR